MIRFRRFLLMLLLSCGVIPIASYYRGKNIYETCALTALGILFFAVTVYYLELLRLQNKTVMGAYDDFRLYSFVYCTLALISAGFSFLPGYLAVVTLFPAVCITLFKDVTGFSLSIYFLLLTWALSGENAYLLVSDILVVTVVSLFIAINPSGKAKIITSLLLFLMNVVIPVIVMFVEGAGIIPLNVLYCVIAGVLGALLYFLISDKLRGAMPKEKFVRYRILLDGSFHLLKEIKACSEAEYAHAKKVSEICGRIAGKLGLDADLSACGGMYYRLGRIAGGEIKDGVRLAEENCFPPELIDIISEYNGECRLPGSRESALVHIVDSVTLKFEVMDKDIFSGSWNRDIMIYSTMNEYSEKGLYDESGLSMNSFLRIRELLTAEDLNGGTI